MEWCITSRGGGGGAEGLANDLSFLFTQWRKDVNPTRVKIMDFVTKVTRLGITDVNAQNLIREPTVKVSG